MKSASTSSSFPGSGGRHEGCAGAMTHDRWPRPLDLNGAIRMLDLRPATGGAFEGRKSAGLPTSGSETRRSGTREPCGRRVVPEGRPMRLSGQIRRSSTKKPPLILPYFCLASHELIVPALSWCRGESPGSAIITADEPTRTGPREGSERTHNPKVEGSNPSPATKRLHRSWGSSDLSGELRVPGSPRIGRRRFRLEV